LDAREWDLRYAASELVWSAAPNQFVERELTDLPPGRALDLAAGEGRNTLWLADRGWEVTAVDFSRAGLDKARTLQSGHERGGDMRIDWVHADVLDYPARPGGFDLVLVAYLQLVEDQRRTAVRRAFDAVADGGTLLMVGHDSSNLTEGTGGPQDPTVLFTAEDVLGDLDGAPFEVLRAERVARVVHPPHGHEHEGDPDRTAYDALVRVRRTSAG
jgi:SAM-dependent methyltransferase